MSRGCRAAPHHIRWVVIQTEIDSMHGKIGLMSHRRQYPASRQAKRCYTASGRIKSRVPLLELPCLGHSDLVCSDLAAIQRTLVDFAFSPTAHQSFGLTKIVVSLTGPNVKSMRSPLISLHETGQHLSCLPCSRCARRAYRVRCV